MAEIVFMFMFFGVAIGTLVWFGRVRRLYSALEQRHEGKYASMGRPSLFMRNNLETNIALIRFLLRKEYLALGDSEIAEQGASMRAHFIIQNIFLVAMFASFFVATTSNAS